MSCCSVCGLLSVEPSTVPCSCVYRLGELNGIDVLLQCVALYKGRDPGTAEEEEFMQVKEEFKQLMQVEKEFIHFMRVKDLNCMLPPPFPLTMPSKDCFDVLCSAMMLPENKQAFVKVSS
eukprot:1136164-Pelagomonas_calceolata.AAC.4